ncbi:uncharacterized protein PV09_02370 [Verruconis gallopava]|uniref:Uncharacterized protein n=1 Tax=Verruconis gallopava TaxID=253628 RepID=A0A0D2B603_9PEZI|nr:uncharacterized protein PV09_02370 [Verruconis gallopava]KIW06664.1 hypothetical protein PV09_02370 [Verruconis gallopava]
MPYKVPFCLKTDEEREKNIEKNLDFIHRTHMEAIFYTYREGKLAQTRELCIRAMDSHRLPSYYRKVYQGLVRTIDGDVDLAAESPKMSQALVAVKGDQADTVEERTTTMLHAPAVCKEKDIIGDKSKVHSPMAIIDSANAFGGGSDETENANLFEELVRLANKCKKDGKDMNTNGTSIRRPSSN